MGAWIGASMGQGAVVEIVEPNHEPGEALMPTRVRVNGVDVGELAKVPKVTMGVDEVTTVTLVLYPSRLEIKGDEDERSKASKIGFR